MFFLTTPVYAHRSGCHRWHSCPSDSGSYICGDWGYCSYCPDNQFCEEGLQRNKERILLPPPEVTPTLIPTSAPTPKVTVKELLKKIQEEKQQTASPSAIPTPTLIPTPTPNPPKKPNFIIRFFQPILIFIFGRENRI